jgi:D-lactate dehydrogenase
VKQSVVDEMVQLMNKAGYEVIFPKGMNKMCCGQIWESKGMLDIADRKSAELEKALWEASNEGEYPILCDQSPCLHRMRKVMPRLKLYEPVEFILKFLKDNLVFKKLDRTVAVHITCSTREMGLGDSLVELASLCATKVVVPEGVGCCGFAGDKGFSHPEMNKHALRHLKPAIERNHVVYGYSNSRTCEIGLQTHSGVPYMSIAYLVNEATTPK